MEILSPSTTVCSGFGSSDSFVEDRHVLQQDIDLGFERVNVNRYLGFDFEFGFSMLILVDVTIFTGSSGMKSCS